mgnify:CR=1 FL=1
MEKAPSASIEEVLGEDNADAGEQSDSEFPQLQKKKTPTKAKAKAKGKKAGIIQITNNTEQISNSSSPFENENLQRKEQ